MADGHAERGIVRILKSQPGRATPVGAGFLVSPGYALTCAHVVNLALGREEYAEDRPSAEIFLDLPAPAEGTTPTSGGSLAPAQAPSGARVVAWHPPREQPQQGTPSDVAVLELVRPSGNAQVLPLLSPGSPVQPGYQGYAYGFPERGSSGIWAKGELSGHQHSGWRQITDVAGPKIEGGFSGGPFLDAAQQRVIGMVVARHRRFPVAYLITVETLVQAWGELPQIARLVELPEPDAEVPTAGTSAGAKAEQQQNVNVTVNIAQPGAPQPAPEASPPPAPHTGASPAAAAGDGRPVLTLRVERRGDRLTVATLGPRATVPRTTRLDTLQQEPGREGQDALFEALFASAHELGDLVQAAGGVPQDADPSRLPLRLRLVCVDAEAASLPWHCLTHQGQRLGDSGWIVEVVDQPDGGPLTVALDNPLVVAPADPTLEIGARIHATQVRAHVQRLLADRRAMVQWVSTRRELDVALDGEPDLVYVFAQWSEQGCLVLGKDAAHRECCPLDHLLARLQRFESKPLLWLHLVERRGAELERAALLRLRPWTHLLLVQTTTRANLERSLNNTLDWMAAMADDREEPAAVLSRFGDPRTHLWLGARSVRLCATTDSDAALYAYIRAALIRVLLGRRTEKLWLFDGIRRARGGDLMLYAVCGDRQACVHDLPEQARQYIEGLDRSIQVENRPIPFSMRPVETVFDDVARQLKQDLSIGPGLPPEEALRRIPVVPPESEDTLVIALSWLLEPADGFTAEALAGWVAEWKQAILEVLDRDEIPSHFRILVGACIQWGEGWPEDSGTTAQALQQALNLTLRRGNPRDYVRWIEMERPLGALNESDLLQFYEDPELSTRLRVERLPLDRLVDYIHRQTGGRFQQTVDLIYRECKYHYAGFEDYLESQGA
jgi:hypothetical protein